MASKKLVNPNAGDKVPLLQDPKVIEALQDRIASMSEEAFQATLPVEVKRRVKALKNLQVARNELEKEFHEEVHKLEAKYNLNYSAVHQKRAAIVNGTYEPNDDEANYPSDEEAEDVAEADQSNGLSAELKKKAVLDSNNADKASADPVKGIPGFWLGVFKNTQVIEENIQEVDEPILELLTDVRVVYQEQPPAFTLEFEFTDDNPFFNNKILTKTYELRVGPDPEDKINYEGPEIVSTKGCEIDWKPNKNVTVKKVQKKQKHKKDGKVRTIEQTVEQDSFFNFFAPPEVKGNSDEEDEETNEILQADFEMGEMVRSQLVPRAVLYFTGEAVDGFSDEEDDEDEEEDSDYEEEDDDDVEESGSKSKSKAARR